MDNKKRIEELEFQVGYMKNILSSAACQITDLRVRKMIESNLDALKTFDVKETKTAAPEDQL
jgi:hypothetical protein